MADSNSDKPTGSGRFSTSAPEFRFSVNAPAFVPGGFTPPLPAPVPAAPVVAAPAPAVEEVVEKVAELTVEAPAPAPVPVPVEEPVKEKESPIAVPESVEEESVEETPSVDDEDAAEEGEVRVPKKVMAIDDREHLNVIHIGHVDSGKSTLSGALLYYTGQIDQRTIEKYEREAKARGRESWWLAYLLDDDEMEREKGITIQVARAFFETPNKRYTILDAPGHKSFVANMVQGAAQADVATLVISARKGEFETGFEKGGQTREHAMLAKTLGVRYLIVAINKMDEPTVNWSKERYDECVSKLTPFLKTCGYSAKQVFFLPVAALSGMNLKDRVSPEKCPWYNGPSLVEQLDSLTVPGRDPDGPLRIPLIDKYIDRGIVSIGKVEMGTVREGQDLLIMPQGVKAKVEKIYINDVEVPLARPGENVKVKVKGCPEDEVQRGYVLCTRENPVTATTQFEVQLMLMELDHRAIFTAGYSAILHLHTAEEEVTVVKLTAELDKKTGQPISQNPRFVKSGALCVCVLKTNRSVCVEKFDVLQQMGRFTLRDEGRTIGIGKVLRLGVKKSA